MTLAPHEDSILVAQHLVAEDIRDALKIVTGRPFEVGQVPANSGGEEDPNVPYGIVYPVPGGGFWGPSFKDMARYAVYEFVIASVGHRADQAQRLREKVREVMIGKPAGPTGRDTAFIHNYMEVAYTDLGIPGNPRTPTYHVQTREPSGPPGGLEREDMIFSASDGYHVKVEAL